VSKCDADREGVRRTVGKQDGSGHVCSGILDESCMIITDCMASGTGWVACHGSRANGHAEDTQMCSTQQDVLIETCPPSLRVSTEESSIESRSDRSGMARDSARRDR
jgi:hypothetical protein